MTWVHVAANGGMGVEKQELLRWHGKPVCSLKESSDGWRASLLNLDGFGARSVLISAVSLEAAKLMCEGALLTMGWTRPSSTAHPAPHSKAERGRKRREERHFVRDMKSRGIAHVDP